MKRWFRRPISTGYGLIIWILLCSFSLKAPFACAGESEKKIQVRAGEDFQKALDIARPGQ